MTAATDNLFCTSGLPSANPMTAMIWYKQTAATDQNILQLELTGDASWQFSPRGLAGLVRVYISPTSFNDNVTPTLPNSWVHSGLTYGNQASGAFAQLYEMGMSDAKSSITPPAIVSTRLSVGLPISGGVGFTGHVMGLKIWNKALSPEQFFLESQYILPVSYVDLYDYWPLTDVKSLVGSYGGHIFSVTGSPTTSYETCPAQWNYVSPKRYSFMSPPATTAIPSSVRQAIFRAATR